MIASGKKVAVIIISSLDAQSYLLYNLDNIKDGCSMSFSDLLFYHLLRGNPCHSVKDIPVHVDKETVVKKLTVKVGWYYN